jgi:hypothetical protein
MFLFVVLVGMLAAPQPAQAQDEACTATLLDCYEKAAKIDNFWYRWAGGIDCELRFTNCARRLLIGR